MNVDNFPFQLTSEMSQNRKNKATEDSRLRPRDLIVIHSVVWTQYMGGHTSLRP